MQVSGTQVVVVVIIALAVVAVVIPQNHYADAVDREAEDGDDNRLVELDRHGLEEAMHAFARHQQGEEGEHHGAGEAIPLLTGGRLRYVMQKWRI